MALTARAGGDCIVTGASVAGFETSDSGAALLLQDGRRETGALAIAADGIHSAIRRQMAPDEGEPIWNGAIMWRGDPRSWRHAQGAAGL